MAAGRVMFSVAEGGFGSALRELRDEFGQRSPPGSPPRRADHRPDRTVRLMVELLKAVMGWPSLVLAVVAFGFAPGFCLRLIVLAYPRTDPRRAELLAEPHAVTRIQRPLWVAEQLEVALFEGLGHRLAEVGRQLTDRHRARAQSDKRGVRRLSLASRTALAEP